MLGYFYRYDLRSTLDSQNLSYRSGVWFEISVDRLNTYRYKAFMLVIYLLSQPHFLTVLYIHKRLATMKQIIFGLSQKIDILPYDDRATLSEELTWFRTTLSDLKDITKCYCDTFKKSSEYYEPAQIDSYFNQFRDNKDSIRLAKKIVSVTLATIRKSDKW